MKQTAAYFLLMVFSVIFTHETVCCFSKKVNSIFIEELIDFETEKQTSEADETDIENDKKEKVSCFYINYSYCALELLKKRFSSFSDFFVFTSVYSKIIYSPPEAIAS